MQTDNFFLKRSLGKFNLAFFWLNVIDVSGIVSGNKFFNFFSSIVKVYINPDAMKLELIKTQ